MASFIRSLPNISDKMASFIHLLLVSITTLLLTPISIAADASVYGSMSFTYDDHTPKPKPMEKPKLSTDKPKPDLQKPTVEKPKQDVGKGIKKPKQEAKEQYETIGVQGVVYCKSGSKLLPLQGAMTRITCGAKDKDGYESHLFTTLSKTTDKKGYFLATLSVSELESKSKLFMCKAFLEKSPLGSCNVPTDVNKGFTGALPLPSYHLLADKKMRLYSVGPFVYTSTKPKNVVTNNGREMSCFLVFHVSPP